MDTPSREGLGRVSVDTAADFERIKASFTACFLSSVDETGVKGAERDALINAAQERVEQIFSLIERNVRTNGGSYASGEEQGGDLEPFDEPLNALVWRLADSRLGWHKKLAAQRRTIPKEVAERLVAVQKLPDPLLQDDLNTGEDVDMESEEVEVGPGDATLAANHARIQDKLYEAGAAVGELDQNLPSQTERTYRLEKVSADIRT